MTQFGMTPESTHWTMTLNWSCTQCDLKQITVIDDEPIVQVDRFGTIEIDWTFYCVKCDAKHFYTKSY